MKKQTAVEWLVEQIIKEKGLVNLDIQAAFEMERQQIETAFSQGEMLSDNYFDPNNPDASCSENYFNETYGK